MLMTFVAVYACSGMAFAGLFGPDIQPVDLRCEYLKNPAGIDSRVPRLSWKLETIELKPERGIRQTAYQVLVATNEKLLEEGKADLWDSDKVESDQSLHIEYKGKTLETGKKYFWKVKTWTTAGNSWSQPASWTMGLLESGDWKAKWIGSPTDEKIEPAPMFRKAFTLDRKIRRATAYICGLGYYELSLNGAKVGDHELDPKFTRYDRRVLYVTYDVTDCVRDGGNAIGVMLGNGWYNYHTLNAWDFEKAPWRAKPALLLQLEVEYVDGTVQTVISDESWKYSTGPVRFDGFLCGETYDARLEKSGWAEAGYDDASWVPARVVDAPKGRLSAQMVQPIRVTEVIKPVKITQPKPGVYLYDIGQNIAGTVRLTVSGSAGTEVKLQYAELLHGDGTLNPGNINSFCKTGEFQTDKYTLKGTGIETWQSRFMYHGFQYVQVTGFPGEPKLENIEALVMHTDMSGAGSFECSNELLNSIQHCTRWSYLNNFHGHPTDCPNRERNGWTGDAHLAAETGLYNFDAATAYTQWMLDFRDEQRESGELPGIVPTGGWGYRWGNGPAWDSAYVLIPWYLYRYCGDERILDEHYENLKRYVDYLTTKAKDGIVGIGLGDWCPAGTQTPTEVTSTGYYYIDAVIVSRMAGILGKKDDCAKYAALAEGIKKAFNSKFLNRQNMQYANGSQTALSCAMYQGLVEPADVDAVMSNLVSNVASHNDHLDCGILGTKYLLHALTDSGRADLAYRITTQTTYPGWGHWIRQGATTLWENWNGGGTHNHIMFGDVSAWFFGALGGIQPDDSGSGFKRIKIRPYPAEGLTWVKCHHDSMYGRIVSNWKRDDLKLTIEVVIPPNTTATVYVPALRQGSGQAKDEAGVTESGKPVEKAKGVKFLRMENGAAVFEVGSGCYEFCSEFGK